MAGGDHWQGFPTLAGESDVWVTAFIVAHLAAIGVPRSALARARAYLIARQDRTAGWSYGSGVPCDADSTAWCLLALNGDRRFSRQRRTRAVRALLSHADEQGRISTYRPGSGIADYIGADSEAAVAGWTSPHADVGAATVLPLRSGDVHDDAVLERMLRWLVAAQTGAGLFEAYWWRGPYYATALTLRACARHERSLPARAAALLRRALRRERLPEGGYGLGAGTAASAFATALALEAWTHLGSAAADRRRTGAALLALQQADGSWSGEFVLRIPAPSVRDPRHVAVWKRSAGGGNSYVRDRDGLFATTLACHALHLWSVLEAARGSGQPRRRPVKAGGPRRHPEERVFSRLDTA